MVQSPSWAANWFAASQEIPRISRNPKVHYNTHRRPPPVCILGQPNPVHIPTSHLLEIHPNIIHPSTPRSPQWSPSLRFPQQDPIHLPLLIHTRHMPSPSHSSRFYHPRFSLYTQQWCISYRFADSLRAGSGRIRPDPARKLYGWKWGLVDPFQSLCSVVGIATGYRLDGPWIESRWGARFSAPVKTGPGAHPASCKMDTGSFPRVKSGQGVTLTPHPLLMPWSRKSRAIPLLPLWAVRPVQSLSACTRVHFTFFFPIPMTPIGDSS